MISEKERFHYLLGNICKKNASINNHPDYNVPFLFTCGMKYLKRNKHLNKEFRFFEPYWNDMDMFCKNTNNIGNKFIVQFGDRPMNSAYGFSKSRKVSEKCSILLPLNTPRHWNFKFIQDETRWESKKETIVWRGATTGRFIRRWYVNELHKSFNVKFSMIVQKKNAWISSQKIGRALSQRQLLNYKYILSLPGNDVATNLKWLMMQNSVIVMPPPKVEGWLMEGLLKPYVHFVPIHHPRNMSSVIHWMRTHDDECKKIVKNANAWIRMAKKFKPVLSWIFEYSKNKKWNQTILHEKELQPSTGFFD
tara:strand:+ start:1319 stop:2239 length:921 start_codon:yes stop_codon:yes gene_type:complete